MSSKIVNIPALFIAQFSRNSPLRCRWQEFRDWRLRHARCSDDVVVTSVRAAHEEMIELMGEENVPSAPVLFRLLRKQKVQDATGWFVVGNPLAHKRPTDVQAQLFPTVGYGKWFVQEMARAEAVVAGDLGAYVSPFAVLDEVPGWHGGGRGNVN
jgi:hypothetical protein